MMYTTVRTTENSTPATTMADAKRYLNDVVSAVNTDVAESIIDKIPSFDSWVRNRESFKHLEAYEEVKFLNANQISDLIHKSESRAFEALIEGLDYSVEEARADRERCEALRKAEMYLDESKACYSTYCNKVRDIADCVRRGDTLTASHLLRDISIEGMDLDAIRSEISTARRERLRTEEMFNAFERMKPYAQAEVKASVDDVLNQKKQEVSKKLDEGFTNTCATIGLASMCWSALKVATKVATKLIK